MTAASDNGAGGARQFLSWPIILELMIAPPATAGIVALLTWWAHPILGENTHWVASASALTPLGLLAYLVLQAVGLSVVLAVALCIRIKRWLNRRKAQIELEGLPAVQASLGETRRRRSRSRRNLREL